MRGGVSPCGLAPELHLPISVVLHALIGQSRARDVAAQLFRRPALVGAGGALVLGSAHQERGESGAYIAATLFVEKESHKAIVIGERGAMLKRIGSAARQEIEAMSGRKIYLELRVKLRKNWRDDEQVLRQMYH